MPNATPNTAIRQEIFQQRLSITTISVYLLCCGLADQQTPVSTRNLADIWNGTAAMLHEGLDTLEARGILRKIISDREDTHIYQLTDIRAWQAPDAPAPE